MVEPHSSNFRVITTNILGVRIFRTFTVVALLHGKISMFKFQDNYSIFFFFFMSFFSRFLCYLKNKNHHNQKYYNSLIYEPPHDKTTKMTCSIITHGYYYFNTFLMLPINFPAIVLDCIFLLLKLNHSHE